VDVDLAPREEEEEDGDFVACPGAREALSGGANATFQHFLDTDTRLRKMSVAARKAEEMRKSVHMGAIRMPRKKKKKRPTTGAATTSTRMTRAAAAKQVCRLTIQTRKPRHPRHDTNGFPGILACL